MKQNPRSISHIPEWMHRKSRQTPSLGCDCLQGLVPVMVNATSGTTVMGSYDPLQPIATICERHGVWLHVDAAWGGSVLLSDKLRYKAKGIER